MTMTTTTWLIDKHNNQSCAIKKDTHNVDSTTVPDRGTVKRGIICLATGGDFTLGDKTTQTVPWPEEGREDFYKISENYNRGGIMEPLEGIVLLDDKTTMTRIHNWARLIITPPPASCHLLPVGGFCFWARIVTSLQRVIFWAIKQCLYCLEGLEAYRMTIWQ